MSVPDQLQIDVRRTPDRIVLRLSGELDLARAPLLQGELESTELTTAAMVVLDLQALEFIDSTGLRVLLTAHERARAHGQEFAITQGSPQVQRLLSISRIDELLPIIDSAEGTLP